MGSDEQQKVWAFRTFPEQSAFCTEDNERNTENAGEKGSLYGRDRAGASQCASVRSGSLAAPQLRNIAACRERYKIGLAIKIRRFRVPAIFVIWNVHRRCAWECVCVRVCVLVRRSRTTFLNLTFFPPRREPVSPTLFKMYTYIHLNAEDMRPTYPETGFI